MSSKRSLKIGIIAFVAASGAIIGVQIAQPAKRVIESIGAFLLVYLVWNFSTLSALWMLLIIYPFPFGISLGHSTMIFIFIIFIVYMIRVSARLSALRFDRQFNLPIVIMLMSYTVSFYNFETTPESLRFGLQHTLNFIASILLFYMIINFVTDERKLHTTVRISMITCALVMLFTVLEMMFPGRTLIPGWLYTEHKRQLVMKDVRMQGPFHDFELTAEYFAMSAPIIFFLAVRARRLLMRMLFVVLLVADIALLFSTVTRGAFISLAAGILYMGYVCRRDLNIVRLMMIGSAFVALVFVIDTFVARYTISGSLFGRMMKTTFESGIVPETRALAWGGAITRGFEHPFIGHGPGWEFGKGIEAELWPHNAYLYYFNITGFFGLFAFLFLLVRLFRASLTGYRASLVYSPFPEALMKVLNVSLVIFIIDQVKIDYLRNNIYMYAVWIFFGLIAATRNVIRSGVTARNGTGRA